jgi:hypothetical protein
MSGLPTRLRGRQSAQAAAQYREDVAAFADRILQLQSRLDFSPSARGWAYVLEGEGDVTKGQFDAAETLINNCRKDGTLPLEICAIDGRREAEGVEILDADIPTEIESWISALQDAPSSYAPISFWDDQNFYLEMAVEKVDLKLLFAPVCREFHIPITNIAGWADLHCRAGMMRRFAEYELAGRQPVLLNCTDHDPGGLNISDWLRANLEELAGAVGWHPDNLIINRFGLDYEFIERLGLTWIDNLETGSGRRLDDPKHPDHCKSYVQDYLRRFGARKVEANALIVRPNEGRELCRQAILKYLPKTAPADYKKRLKPHRDALKQALVKRLAGGLT